MPGAEAITISDQAIVTRLLSPTERPRGTDNGAMPIVFEPRGAADLRTLCSFLSGHGSDLEQIVQRHGAILLRNFGIDSEADFERAVLSIPGLHPMSGYFMSEPGRERAAGSRYVFHTNTLARTGGTLRIGAIHSENYYSMDVPAVQCFWCKRPPLLGGETALFAMADVYAELTAACRAKLDRERFFVRSWPVSAIAESYRVSEAAAEQLLDAEGWPLATWDGVRRVLLYKPSVWRHPTTRRPALQVNLSGESATFEHEIRRRAQPQYAGWTWILHRWSWRHHAVRRPPARSGPPGLGAVLDARELEALGEAVWRNRSMFTWRRGDLLMFDNLQLAHAGMPGLGRRELRVMLCNPVSLQPRDPSGVLDLAIERVPRVSMHDRLTSLGEAA
jgi:alpha-ketoglutarate-dependent taurine dioxygenase